MKSLADQVQEYMDWRREKDGVELSTATLAAEVAEKQREKGVAHESRCKRQDIDHVLKNNVRNPRYGTALAAAMGTTWEILKAGKYVAGAPIPRALTMLELNGVEGQLVTMFRGLAEADQARFLASLSHSYQESQTEPAAHVATVHVAPSKDPAAPAKAVVVNRPKVKEEHR